MKLSLGPSARIDSIFPSDVLVPSNVLYCGISISLSTLEFRCCMSLTSSLGRCDLLSPENEMGILQ